MGLGDLLRDLQLGKEGAFEQLYIQSRRGIFAFLYTYFHNYHDSEDAMQTVFLKIKENIHLYDHQKGGRGWVLTIAKNVALNELRRRSRVDVVDNVPEGGESESTEVSLALSDLMSRVLTEEENRILVWHILWGYKHREIAQILNVPTGTVTSKYKRALAKLKKAMKEENL